MTTFLIIIALVLTIYLIFSLISNLLNKKRMPKDTVIALTGGLGTGKTLIAVKESVKDYKKRLILWRLGMFDDLVKKRPFPLPNKKTKAPMPLFYSNIPIKLKRPFYISKKHIPNKEYFSNMLTYDHILMFDRIEEYSTILIDEVGQIADQYQYDNPFVMQNIQNFIRFYRHFIDGRLFVTDQSSSNIVVAVRRRINVIYNLHDFRRTLLYFYKVNVSTVMITEDMLSINEVNSDDDQEFEYFFGHLPLKWFKFLDITRPFSRKYYESRVYKPLYDGVEHKNLLSQWTQYTTKYLIDVPNNNEMKKKFRSQGYLSNEDMKKFIEQYQGSSPNH